MESLLNINMGVANLQLTEDQLRCPICLEVFKNPVTTECGHSFCKSCFDQHWEEAVVCKCPMCKKLFPKRPELQVNIFMHEMATQYRQSVKMKQNRCSEKLCAESEVPCDICDNTKLEASKSCLVCVASHCEKHLESHLTVSALQKHQLVDPVKNLEGRICKKHNKPLELFCKNDQICICVLCTVLDHRTHTVVSVKDECDENKVELKRTEAKIQDMIEEIQLNIQDLKHSVKLSDEDADREKAGGAHIFDILREFLEKSFEETMKTIEEKQITTKEQTDVLITKLEEKISELEKKNADLQQLSHSKDDLDFLHIFPVLNSSLPTMTRVSIPPPVYEGIVRKTMELSVNQLEQMGTLWEISNEMLKAELKKVQHFAVDVTLDLNTANSFLDVSHAGKQARCAKEMKKLPNNPERFSHWFSVLGSCGYSSGKFYFEVQVKGKTAWYVGVARQSVNRKAAISMSPQNGFWQICLTCNENKASDDPPLSLTLKSKPEKVGVFVDFEEGVVSFYDAEAADHIFSFTGCTFNDTLYPFFNPCGYDHGRNSAPLIITPVTFIK